MNTSDSKKRAEDGIRLGETVVNEVLSGTAQG